MYSGYKIYNSTGIQGHWEKLNIREVSSYLLRKYFKDFKVLQLPYIRLQCFYALCSFHEFWPKLCIGNFYAIQIGAEIYRICKNVSNLLKFIFHDLDTLKNRNNLINSTGINIKHFLTIQTLKGMPFTWLVGIKNTQSTSLNS